ncbi:hypothetical protein C8R43DRAFT_1138717 [Mycena crocata]|nr:hypothetical protein C8R43DRAFT_1138717 [Mycena crocata]
MQFERSRSVGRTCRGGDHDARSISHDTISDHFAASFLRPPTQRRTPSQCRKSPRTNLHPFEGPGTAVFRCFARTTIYTTSPRTHDLPSHPTELLAAAATQFAAACRPARAPSVVPNNVLDYLVCRTPHLLEQIFHSPPPPRRLNAGSGRGTALSSALPSTTFRPSCHALPTRYILSSPTSKRGSRWTWCIAASPLSHLAHIRSFQHGSLTLSHLQCAPPLRSLPRSWSGVVGSVESLRPIRLPRVRSDPSRCLRRRYTLRGDSVSPHITMHSAYAVLPALMSLHTNSIPSLHLAPRISSSHFAIRP